MEQSEEPVARTGSSLHLLHHRANATTRSTKRDARKAPHKKVNRRSKQQTNTNSAQLGLGNASEKEKKQRKENFNEMFCLRASMFVCQLTQIDASSAIATVTEFSRNHVEIWVENLPILKVRK